MAQVEELHLEIREKELFRLLGVQSITSREVHDECPGDRPSNWSSDVTFEAGRDKSQGV
uniref:Uncharacterized protein n=1 Tax=Cucumis melo TaxID=3656 RepID=A0A9I9DCT9_CUCME